MNDKLVDIENGLVSRKIFYEEDIYQQELEKIFARCWLFVAHESQIPNPGDFVSSYMGEDPVIVWRDPNGKIGVYINSCRHRGMRVCRTDGGNSHHLTCPYHGWTYNSQGKLQGVPGFKEAYKEKLDLDQWGLIPAAQIDTYAGLIFATFDPTAPPLDDYLGDMKWYLDIMLNAREGGSEAIVGVQKWKIPSNWKFGADNFIGDMAHAYSHQSAVKVGFLAPGGMGGGQANAYLGGEFYEVNAGNGHGLGFGYYDWTKDESDPSNYDKDEYDYYRAVIGKYNREIAAEVEERLGTLRSKMLPGHFTIFPNFSCTISSRTYRVWHPRGPHEMEIWHWCFVDKKAPEEVKDAFRKVCLLRFGAGGSWEEDDAENWTSCTESTRGWVSRQYPFNYQMGLNEPPIPKDELPGTIGPKLTEMNQRAFYEQWNKMIQGKDWSELIK